MQNTLTNSFDASLPKKKFYSTVTHPSNNPSCWTLPSEDPSEPDPPSNRPSWWFFIKKIKDSHRTERLLTRCQSNNYFCLHPLMLVCMKQDPKTTVIVFVCIHNWLFRSWTETTESINCRIQFNVKFSMHLYLLTAYSSIDESLL